MARYKENPLWAILLPVTLLVGGGITVAMLLKKKAAPSIPAGAGAGAGTEYPYAYQPDMTASMVQDEPHDATAQVQQVAEKYGSPLTSAAKTIWSWISPSSSTPPAPGTQAETAPQLEPMAVAGGEGEGATKQEIAKAATGQQASKAAVQATVTAASKLSLKTIGYAGIVVAAVVAVGMIVNGISTFNRKVAKYKSKKKTYLAYAIAYGNQTIAMGKQLEELIKADDDMENRIIPILQNELAARST